jgi:hypothetical protein
LCRHHASITYPNIGNRIVFVTIRNRKHFAPWIRAPDEQSEPISLRRAAETLASHQCALLRDAKPSH